MDVLLRVRRQLACVRVVFSDSRRCGAGEQRQQKLSGAPVRSFRLFNMRYKGKDSFRFRVIPSGSDAPPFEIVSNHKFPMEFRIAPVAWFT
jgi:hypothetical protein